jgi:hypothetical protein
VAYPFHRLREWAHAWNATGSSETPNALSPLDLFPGVETDLVARIRTSFHALAVDDRGGGAFFSAFEVAAVSIERIVQPRPGSVTAPALE